MAGKRVRRSWAEAEKLMIVAQTRMPGVSVSQVARRYDVNANMVFKWLRDPRYSAAQERMGDFLPVTIAADPPATKISRPPVLAPAEFSVEITTSGGCKVRVEGGFDVGRLCELVRGLER
jgi:transposase